MATEDVVILKVGTDEAIKSVGDLRNNIKELKKSLNETQIDSKEGWLKYQETLNELKVNQNALKDAMYATSGSLQDVADAATGASNSYNSLVHRMAALKEEWRATNDEARRNELGKQIAEINQELKNMDASVGNFQRNVGNYESGVSGLVAKFDDWGGILKQMPPTLGATKESIGKVGETMQLVGKQPILGIIGLLAPIIIKITEALKDNETAMDGVKKVMELLQPIFNFLNGILEKIAQGFVILVEKIATLVGGSGWFNKVVSSVMGVGNAMLQYLLTPIRTIVEAFKGLGNIMKDVFTGQFGKIKEDATNAWEGIKNAFSKGFSIKANFETGKELGEQIINGISSPENEKKAEETGEKVAEKVTKPIKRNTRYIENIRNEEATAEEKFTQKMGEEWKKRTAETIEANKIEREEAEKTRQARIATLDAVASSTSTILNSIADMYEANGEADKKQAKKAKNLRVVAATIDMLQGAVTAFSSAQALPPPFGQIVGAANAAAVIAMGVANISKIKSSNVDSASGNENAMSVSASAPASVSAPSIETSMTSVRNVTSATEEDRLNRMASSQKVYILQSDIEAANNQSKVQVAESSF